MAKKANSSTKHFEEQFGRRVPKKPFMPKGSENWQENAGFKKATGKGEATNTPKHKAGKAGAKPPFGDAPKTGDKPFGRSFNSKYAKDTTAKDSGFKKEFKGERTDSKKTFGVKPEFTKTEFGKKPFVKNGEDKKFGDRKFGDKPNGERKSADKPYGDRKFGDRKIEDKKFGEKKYGDKPYGEKKFSDKPYSERKPGDKPYGDKKFSDKPNNERKPFANKTWEPKPEREFKKSSFTKSDGEGKGDFKNKSTYKDFRTGQNAKANYAKPIAPYKKNTWDKPKQDIEKQAVKKITKEGDLEIIETYQDDYITHSHNKREGKQNNSLIEEQMPLNKFVSRCGISGRREAAELIKAGKIQVNSVVELKPQYRVQETDVITHNGKKLFMQHNLVYVLLNKPKDFITTSEDPEGRKTVMDLVANAVDERIYPVGRLDRNTSGLLLLTNDGELAQKMSHPKYAIKKLYQVNLDKPLIKPDFDNILAGITLEDGIANVDQLAYVDAADKTKIGIEIHSGKNRIVRRIFESQGYIVKQLDRVMYANLTKKNLPRGKWRFLNESEVRNLKHY